MSEIISAAVLLILIMDPLGNLPIFMSVLKHTGAEAPPGDHDPRAAHRPAGDVYLPVCG